MKARPCTRIAVVGLKPATSTALRCSASPSRASPNRRGRERQKLLLVAEPLGCRGAVHSHPVRRLVGVLVGLGLLSSLGRSVGCEAATVKIGERSEDKSAGVLYSDKNLCVVFQTLLPDDRTRNISSCAVVGRCPTLKDY